MKWYGRDESVGIVEHGDEELQKWQQESVAIKDTFQFTISVYDSWHKDVDLYDSHKRDDSFVSLANEFAKDNWLMYFAEGFPAEWIEQEIIDGEKNWNHFIVKPDDKNIDRICEVYYDYGMAKLKEDNKEFWYQARDKIKQLMENRYECEYAK